MSAIENSYWLIPQHLMAGPYPAGQYREEQNRQQLEWLLQQGIRHILDFTRPGERIAYQSLFERCCTHLGIKGSWQRIAITDFGLPSRETMQQILDTIDRLMMDGGVYFHCSAGLGRTGTVAGCWLVHQGMTGEQALQKLQTLRKDCTNKHYFSPENDTQREFVMKWGK